MLKHEIRILFFRKVSHVYQKQGEREDLKKLRGLGGLGYRGVVKL